MNQMMQDLNFLWNPIRCKVIQANTFLYFLFYYLKNEEQPLSGSQDGEYNDDPNYPDDQNQMMPQPDLYPVEEM